MTEFNANATITYSVGGIADDYQINNCQITGYWHQWYPDYWKYYYPTMVVPQEDKMNKAFRIAKMLMDKGIVKPYLVKEFVELVEGIVKEL